MKSRQADQKRIAILGAQDDERKSTGGRKAKTKSAADESRDEKIKNNDGQGARRDGVNHDKGWGIVLWVEGMVGITDALARKGE